MNRIEQIRQHMEAMIQKFGWFVQGVFPTAGSPGQEFSYSVGLHDKGLPEVLVIGLPMQSAHVLVNDVANYLVAQKEKGWHVGETLLNHDNWPMPFYLLPAADDTGTMYATGAHRRSSGAAKYLQVVWPDTQGLFPWQTGYEDRFRPEQSVLGFPAEVKGS